MQEIKSALILHQEVTYIAIETLMLHPACILQPATSSRAAGVYTITENSTHCSVLGSSCQGRYPPDRQLLAQSTEPSLHKSYEQQTISDVYCGEVIASQCTDYSEISQCIIITIG